MKYKITGKFNAEKIITVLERFQYQNLSTDPKLEFNKFEKKTSSGNLISISLKKNGKSDQMNIIIGFKLNNQQLIKVIALRFLIFFLFSIFFTFYSDFAKQTVLENSIIEWLVIFPLSIYVFKYFWYSVKEKIYKESDAQKIQDEILLTEEQ